MTRWPLREAAAIKAIAATSATASQDGEADDDDIEQALNLELNAHHWWKNGVNSLTVIDGAVHMWGFYETKAELDAARVAAENTAGVREVVEHRTRYPLIVG